MLFLTRRIFNTVTLLFTPILLPITDNAYHLHLYVSDFQEHLITIDAQGVKFNRSLFFSIIF